MESANKNGKCIIFSALSGAGKTTLLQIIGTLDRFVEREEVYPDNFYGTLKSEIEKSWANNKVVVFDVDAEGGINLKKIFGNQSLAIFIKPPSLFVLEQRLRNRRTESEENIKMRIEKANREMERASLFDYVLLNDNLENACKEIKGKVLDFINQK